MNFKFAKEVHHPVTRKFERRKVVVTGIDEIWAMDLASMESFSKYNDGFKYILCVIDVFSKYVWCVALKNKTASTVLDSVEKIVSKSKRIPDKIWVDRGSEFYNKDFQKWAKDNEITIYSTYGESKSVVVERFIRTLKGLITSYFTATNSRDWVSNLQTIVEEYNNHEHSTIKMTPTEASDPENEVEVFMRLNTKSSTQIKKPKFKVGDLVRISRVKGEFEKGYESNFSYEVFKVSEVLKTNPVTYKLLDYNDEPIQGSFYTQELLKTETPEYYEVEKILDTRKSGKRKEYGEFLWLGQKI